MNTRLLSLILILFFVNNIIDAQEVPDFIPPSPNAASLAQYADIPVSNYTGVPNISIPLFSIKSGEIELPISLNYHAGGIKVEQESSWVGLGWALNAGGVITREVRDQDDFVGTYTYPTASDLPPQGTYYICGQSGGQIIDTSVGNPIVVGQISGSDIDAVNNAIDYDSEPDMFSFNFFGYSGKFMFEKQSGGLPNIATSIDQNNLHIQGSLEGFTITDGNGWKFYFGINENSVELSKTYNRKIFEPLDVDIEDNPQFTEEHTYGNPVINSWYLSKVETPNGDNIEFDYKRGHSVSQVSFSEEERTILSSIGTFPSGIYPGTSYHYFINRRQLEETYLEKIRFNDGSLVFTTKDREDLQKDVNQSEKPQCLDYIELFDNNLKLLKKIELDHSYFLSNNATIENPQNYKRLKLNSIQEFFESSNGSMVSKPSYNFYYNSFQLPKKTSFKIDHWGFFNNRSSDYVLIRMSDNADGTINSTTNNLRTMIPAYLNPGYPSVPYTGADRETDLNAIKASILESIKYPTGAIINFEYEPHQYQRGTNLFDTPTVADHSAVNVVNAATVEVIPPVYSPGQELIDIKEFSLSTDKIVNLRVDITNPDGFYNNEIEVRIETQGGVEITTIKPSQFANGESYAMVKTISLEAGDYKLIADFKNESYLDEKYCYATLTYNEYTIGNPIVLGGGVRIKSIESLDHQGKFINKTKYNYERNFSNEGLSNGHLLMPRLYHYIKKYVDNQNGSTYTVINQLVRTSKNLLPSTTSAHGNPVGYEKVSVKRVDSYDSEIGEIKYTYKADIGSPPEDFLGSTEFESIENFENGNLLLEEHLNQIGKTIKKVNYEYERGHQIKIPAAKFNTDSYTCNVIVYHFDIHSEWWYPSKTTETIYDIDGNNPITTITDYEYNDSVHKNITSTVTTNSNGEVLKTNLEYPSDYPTDTGMSTATFDQMVSENMLNPVIKQETTLDGVPLSTQISTYKIWDLDNDNIVNDIDDVLLTEKVKTLKGTFATSNIFDERIVFHNYNEAGRPIEVSKTDGTHIYYIWGYNNEYPIAKIENFTSSQALAIQSSLINPAVIASDADIDNSSEQILRDKLELLRNHSVLDNTMVTTYTYDLVIGITSITDPKGYTMYYEYDEFNRLKQVKDSEGKILSQNNYNYKGTNQP